QGRGYRRIKCVLLACGLQCPNAELLCGGTRMRLNRILVLVAVALFAAHTAHADDSGLKVGGGSGSPPCLTFSLSADSSGEVSNASGGNGLCENASNADYTFVGFTVL